MPSPPKGVGFPDPLSGDFKTEAEPKVEPAADLLIRLNCEDVRVRSYDKCHACWLRALVLDVEDYDGRNVAGDVAVYPGKSGWWVAVSGEPHQHFESLPAAHWYLIRLIWRACQPDKAWLALLHASSIAIDEHPVIFAGTSGSGKSSLAAYLVAQGARHVSDDIVPIDAAQGAVWPVPTRASVKEGSWAALTSVWETISVGAPLIFNNGTVRLVEIDPSRRIHEPLQKKPLVIFPIFEKNAATQTIDIDSLELLAGLGNTGTIFPDQLELLRKFLHWTENLHTHILHYSDPTSAMQEVEAMVSRLN